MTKIIYFTGAQNSGKTTLMNSCAKALRKKGYTCNTGFPDVISSISRDAMNKGFKINNEADFISEYYITLQYLVKDLEVRTYNKKKYDYWLLDRSVFDSMIYCKVLTTIDLDDKKDLIRLVKDHLIRYSPILVYCEILDTISNDGYRSMDVKYQKLIDDLFRKELHIDTTIEAVSLVLKNDSIENRTKVFMDNYKQLWMS